MRPDPTDDEVDLMNPQSWNRYTYVLNNPVNFFDPFGKAGQDDEEKKEKTGFFKRVGKKIGEWAKSLWRAVIGTPDQNRSETQKANIEAKKEATEALGDEFVDRGQKAADTFEEVVETGAAKAGEYGSEAVVYYAGGAIVGGIGRLARLSAGEIKLLKKSGLDPHDLKAGYGKGVDIFKDRAGNLYVAPMKGKGVPEPLGVNINEIK